VLLSDIPTIKQHSFLLPTISKKLTMKFFAIILALSAAALALPARNPAGRQEADAVRDLERGNVRGGVRHEEKAAKDLRNGNGRGRKHN